MFKGKVYVYKNVNGKEEKFEREFDNPQDFQACARQNDSWGLNKVSFPSLGLGDWVNLNNYFEDLIDRRVGLPSLTTSCEGEDCDTSNIVDLNRYEEELQRIEYQKQHKDENLKSLKSTLQKLKDYKKQFKNEGRDDMVTQLDEDIKKVESEITSLEK